MKRAFVRAMVRIRTPTGSKDTPRAPKPSRSLELHGKNEFPKPPVPGDFAPFRRTLGPVRPARAIALEETLPEPPAPSDSGAGEALQARRRGRGAGEAGFRRSPGSRRARERACNGARERPAPSPFVASDGRLVEDRVEINLGLRGRNAAKIQPFECN